MKKIELTDKNCYQNYIFKIKLLFLIDFIFWHGSCYYSLKYCGEWLCKKDLR